MNLKKSVLIITGVILMVVLSACSTAQPQSQAFPANVRTLNVTGRGEVYLVPDLAYINVGVHTEADTVTDALDQNSLQALAISDVLVAAGVEKKDIQTSAFNVYPMQTYGPEGEVTGTLYVVDNIVYVTVRDLAKLGQILDGVVRSGANSINSISFDVADKAKATTDARKLAIENAKVQAQELADAAGITLGDLMSVNVYSTSGYNPVYRMDAGASMSAQEVPVAAGTMVIVLEANMTYEIK